MRNPEMTREQAVDVGANRMICFAVVECELGSVAIAATKQGICSIQLGDDADELREDLYARFTKARLVEDDAEITEFDEWVARVVQFVETPDCALDLPLDVQGTAFQRTVWEQLRSIPPGVTKSYTDLAESLGRPKAVRAVANACAANQIALAIPCHRIVRKNGELSDYRWGAERKRELIAREASCRSRTTVCL
jgi:AraC family transcriptional regulator of adaptative response/methylated-DNA-[protein]-cysteine methyltransferase